MANVDEIHIDTEIDYVDIRSYDNLNAPPTIANKQNKGRLLMPIDWTKGCRMGNKYRVTMDVLVVSMHPSHTWPQKCSYNIDVVGIGPANIKPLPDEVD